jgi:hypothetical protein
MGMEAEACAASLLSPDGEMREDFERVLNSGANRGYKVDGNKNDVWTMDNILPSLLDVGK